MANLICRSCAMPLSTVFVDLGLTPISNAFVHPEDAERAEKFYPLDRKSTRLNSSHSQISYAVFCLKKKKNLHRRIVAARFPLAHQLSAPLPGPSALSFASRSSAVTASRAAHRMRLALLIRTRASLP